MNQRGPVCLPPLPAPLQVHLRVLSKHPREVEVSTTPEHLVRCVFGLILALAFLNHSGFSVKMYALEPDQSKRIVPTPFANRVWIIDALLKPDSSKFTRGSLVDTKFSK